MRFFRCCLNSQFAFTASVGSPASEGGTKDEVRCNWLMVASMECVSLRWFWIEWARASVSWVRVEVSVVRARRKDLRNGAARVFRPGGLQLAWVMMKKEAGR